MKLLEAGEMASYDDGEILISAGEENEQILIVTDGTALAFIDGKKVAQVSEGAWLGELSYFKKQEENGSGVATATVVAAENMRCFKIGHDALATLTKKNPELKANIGNRSVLLQYDRRLYEHRFIGYFYVT